MKKNIQPQVRRQNSVTEMSIPYSQSLKVVNLINKGPEHKTKKKYLTKSNPYSRQKPQ